VAPEQLAPITDIDERSPVELTNGSRIFTSPLARRLAQDAGIAIGSITGTGPNGRIIRRDVEAAIAAQLSGQRTVTFRPSAVTAAMPSRTSAKPIAEGEVMEVPHSRVRRAIAQHLTESKRTIPHYYLHGSAQVDELLAIRAGLNETSPIKISVNDFIIKVAARAHQLVPAMNVMWTDDYVRKMSTVDIGTAVATTAGLVSPVLRGVEEMPLSLVAATTRDFVERAREGSLHQQELEGGVSTVTNLGMYGTEEFAAIINPPQSSILAVGAVREEPVVTKRGKVRARSVIHVILSIDHRPIDGTTAAQWMQAFLDGLEHPMHLLG
jgi:pyruvate dehydrogenase E2 component (dihydrolipoamide acetyltransferase)